MSALETDVVIVGAGPVGLLCAFLGRLRGMRTLIVDKSTGPLEVGRADALNARTLQLLEVVGLFDELYPLGKPCNTSSVWADGKFVSRQSSWWESLEGCFHKHFLMLGQSFVESLLDGKLAEQGAAVRRNTTVSAIDVVEDGCVTKLSTGETVKSKFVIGADGSRSFVRERFEVGFQVTRPQIVWAVVDGVIATDFAKVPEIIVFQADTSDVAWIPREGNIDRFYIRMDTKDFTFDEVVAKINRAMQPHTLRFEEVTWFSHFSVKESVAERYAVQDRVFLAGDACHIHSVNGGQGLNTGLADAFNLMWKLDMVLNHGAPVALARTYEEERKPVAMSVIATSGELVRSTKHSDHGTHAEDYVKIVERRAGNITGMGIRYGDHPLHGQRLLDFAIGDQRIYSKLDYRCFTLLVFGDATPSFDPPPFVKVVPVANDASAPYTNQVLLVRPDAYIASSSSLDDMAPIAAYLAASASPRARTSK